MDAIPRLLDPVLQSYTGFVPAFVIDGIKAVGKTFSAERIAKTVFKLDRKDTRELIGASPEAFFDAEKPLLFDEWQRLPELWDSVRRAVDEDNEPGRFILTGSAYPKGAAIHSGAGRIIHIRMRPLSLYERLRPASCVSLASLLGDRGFRAGDTTGIGLDTYLAEIVRSGFPGLRRLSVEASGLYLDSYLENLFNREFEEQGYTVRKPHVLRNWLRAYAAATGSTASYQAILDAATPGDGDKPAKKTTQSYRDILDNLWITDRIEPWMPMNSGFKYVGRTPKHYLADPALAARALGITQDSFFGAGELPVLGPQEKSMAGRLFEALVGLSLQTYAQIAGARLSHFRTNQGDHEVDFVVEKGRRILAIEVKLGASADSNQVDHLNWFEQAFSTYEVVKALVTTGDTAYTRQDGVHVIPAALLGP
jgi:predicted AAA+ superfamily ATPase